MRIDSRAGVQTRQQVALISGLILALTGCMTWHNPNVAPGALIEQQRPIAIRVQRQDRSRVVLYRPMISGDSLVGNITRKKTAGIPLSDVSTVSVQRVNGGLTGLGVVSVAAVIGMLIAASTIQIGF